MSEAIFYKSNNDELCRCELESNQEIVSQRKKDFEEYLDKKVEKGELSEQVARTYISQTLAFLQDLYDKKLIFCDKQNCQNLLFEISSTECLRLVYQAMNKSFQESDEVYCTFNSKYSSYPSACFKMYMSFLEQEKKEIKYMLTQEEKTLFSQALHELIFEVDECVKRDKRTKQDKISNKGTTSKKIKEYLSFLKKYNIEYQVGIGNSRGFLNPNSYIIFAPTKILDEKFVNGKTLTPSKGVYVYFSYFGYLQGERGYGLYFGFPNGEKNQEHGDPNKSQCVAVRKMQEESALQTYDFTYTHLDFEKIINDFEEMMNYFLQFPSSDFALENSPKNEIQSSKNRKFWLYKAGENGDKWENMYAEGLIGIGWRGLGDLNSYDSEESIEEALKKHYPNGNQGRKNDKRANWDFCHKINQGDIIIVGNGRTEFLGYGEVIGDYFYDPNLDDRFASFREVQWIQKGEWEWQKAHDKDNGWASKTLTNITPYQEELKKLLQLIGFDQSCNLSNKPNQPLNQILYGSPATGKTYSTIDKALEILEFDIQTMTRQKKRELFEEYREKGQIEFVTFHQSYGYEEFVEGIKPLTDDKKNVYYEVTSGIFKTLCHRARKNLEDSQKTKEVLQKEVDISNAISDFFNESISEGASFSKTQGGKFTLKEIQNEKVYIQTEDTDANLNFSISDFEKIVLSNKDFKSSRELALEVFEEKNQSQIRTYMFQLYKEFRKGNFNQSQSQIVEEVKRQNYILIIDEINRGNISKIFGELITLIEPSKRIGEKEELRVTLPYSQDSFGVPSNLYIIGTMNTADRSITSLDTALRRRFEFVEMMPNPSELQNIKVYKNNQETEIELQAMLEKINKRIEFLYDREKTIGHAFFLKDEEQTSLDIQELKNIFQNKIIPLLQEYFYNDYAQIYAVLNCNAMIEKNKEEIGVLFAMDRLSDELDLEDKTIYTIADKENALWENPQTYIDIYKKS